MSMTTNTFGAPAPVAAPVVAPPVTEAPAESSRRTVIILGVVAAALALGIGAYFLLFAGDTTAPASTSAAPVAPQAVATPAPALPPITKYVAKKARNPFVPLVSPPVAAAAGAGAGTTTGAGTGTSPGTTSGTGTATGITGTTAGTTGTTTGTTTGSVPLPAPTPLPSPTPLTSSKPVGVSVLAVDYTKRTASIKINRTTYDRTIGESFATFFKLIGVTKSGCAYVQYGDVALPMCVGQPVVLQ